MRGREGGEISKQGGVISMGGGRYERGDEQGGGEKSASRGER